MLELRSYGAEQTRHDHSYPQLVLPLQGSLELEIGSRSGRVAAGVAAVIHSGENHSFLARTSNRFIVADLPASANRQLESLSPFIQLGCSVRRYLGVLGAALQNKTLDSELQRDACDLLLQLLGNAAPEQTLDRRLQLALDYIAGHFQHPLTLTELSRIAHLSPRQLHSLFQRQLGLTPSEHLLRTRMDHALSLLRDSSLSIQQIAEQCGYSNLSAFSDRFRRVHGRAPSAWRRVRANDHSS